MVSSLLALSAFVLGALALPGHRNRASSTTIAVSSSTPAAVASSAKTAVAAIVSSTAAAGVPRATAWNPPSGMVTALDQVWEHTMQENPGGLSDKNWILDQLMANKGQINYCVRWNTKTVSTAALREKTQAALDRSLQKWVDTMIGFDGFPLTTVNTTVVGYAVKDKSILQGDVSALDIYTSTADPDGVPECDPRCYRAIHLDGVSSCPGGAQNRYDISLWLDDSISGGIGGYGYNWGQELPPGYFFETVDQDNVHILLHEMGHGFGLLDFYDWVPQGQTSFVMMAGSAMQVTEFDAWMLRQWWTKLKPVRGW